MTARRRVTLSFREAEAIAAERRQIAMRTVVEEIAARFPMPVLRELIGNLALAGGAEQLLAALRKQARATAKVPDIGGTARPDPAVWAETVGGKPGDGGGG